MRKSTKISEAKVLNFEHVCRSGKAFVKGKKPFPCAMGNLSPKVEPWVGSLLHEKTKLREVLINISKFVAYLMARDEISLLTVSA